MLMIAVTFLIFCGAAFAQFDHIVKSMTQAILNGDISLFVANVGTGTPISIKEADLIKFLDQDPIVEDYTFIGWTMNQIICGDGDENYDEMWIGFGTRTLEYFSVTVHAMERDHLDISGTQYFFPETVWDGRSVLEKEYRADEMLKLMDDLGEHPSTHLSAETDVHRVVSNVDDGSGESQEFESQVINMVIAEALAKVLPVEPSGIYELCLGKKRNKEIPNAHLDECEVISLTF